MHKAAGPSLAFRFSTHSYHCPAGLPCSWIIPASLLPKGKTSEMPWPRAYCTKRGTVEGTESCSVGLGRVQSPRAGLKPVVEEDLQTGSLKGNRLQKVENLFLIVEHEKQGMIRPAYPPHLFVGRHGLVSRAGVCPVTSLAGS